MNATSNPVLRDLILQITDEYVPAKSEPFIGHRIGSLFRHTFPEVIYNTGIVNPSKYLIVGSVGQGQWATVPWICIFDRSITTTATHGVYIVYLLAKDGSALYLTLNQGCSDIRASHTKKETIQIMRQQAEEILKEIDTLDFFSDDRLDLGSGLTELAELYQKGTILYKAYKKESIPDEATLRADLLKMMQIYLAYANRQQTGVFDSWEIVDAHTAIKHCDKSFFKYNGSGIPRELNWFFGVDALIPGAKMPINLSFGPDTFRGRIVVENSDMCRVRIFWDPRLGSLFKKYGTRQGVLARFISVGNRTFSVSIKESGKIWYPLTEVPCITTNMPIVHSETEVSTMDADENKPRVVEMKAGNLTLEEKLREALRAESARNKFGVTLLFLRLAVKCDNPSIVKAILRNARWAKSLYGRYYYVDDAMEDNAEIVEKAGTLDDRDKTAGGFEKQTPRENVANNSKDEIVTLIKDAGLAYIHVV